MSSLISCGATVNKNKLFLSAIADKNSNIDVEKFYEGDTMFVAVKTATNNKTIPLPEMEGVMKIPNYIREVIITSLDEIIAEFTLPQ